MYTNQAVNAKGSKCSTLYFFYCSSHWETSDSPFVNHG